MTGPLSGLTEQGAAQRPAKRGMPLMLTSRYEVLQKLGAGGFGEVYLAKDRTLGRLVAVKLQSGKHAAYATSALREARAIAALQHPNIVAIHDYISDPTSGLMIVMEYVKGQTLRQWINRGELAFDRTAEIVLEISAALGHAHQANIIHRDLKPSNVLLEDAGRVRLTDFGLALLALSGKANREMCGTPRYMAPEQIKIESHRIDGRTDLWALGVILYEMLTRISPFKGVDNQTLFQQILRDDPVPPRQLDPRIPEQLERICLTCLRKPMRQRYSTAADFADDVRDWLSGFRRESSHQSSPASRSATPESVEEHSTSSSTSRSREHLWITPKGLRPFDVGDTSEYLQLVPGPRDRNGVPESIRFWTSWAEAAMSALPVGVLYGSSGAGKTSFVRAGLMNCLERRICPVYVECRPGDLSEHIGRTLSLRFERSNSRETLAKILVQLRTEPEQLGSYRRLLLILDQFESWLHQANNEEIASLADALRQCDGQYLMALIVVRDDYWLGVSELLQQLELPLQEYRNLAMLELLDRNHARRILTALGRSYETLPASPAKLSAKQQQFVAQAVDELAQRDRVVAVHLVMFAQMMQFREWAPNTLRKFGGVRGACVDFLYQQFEGDTASPQYREVSPAVVEVMSRLLPPLHLNVRGHAVSEDQLLAAMPNDRLRALVPEALRILADDLRLITPTRITDDTGASGTAAYQLAHDFLIGPVRAWIETVRKSTWRGRAVARLNELAELYNSQPQRTILPTFVEFVPMLLSSRRHATTSQQQAFLRQAGRHHLRRVLAMALALFAVAALSIWALHQREEAQLAQTVRAASQMDLLAHGPVREVPEMLATLQNSPQLVRKNLPGRIDSVDPQTRTRVGLLAQRLQPDRFAPLEPLIAIAEPELFPQFLSAAATSHDALPVLRRLAQEPFIPLTHSEDAEDPATQLQQTARSRAILLLACLGEIEPFAEAVQIRPDAREQTALLVEAARWHGAPEPWFRMLRDHGSDESLGHALMGILGSYPARTLSEDLPWEDVLALAQGTNRLLHSTACWLLEVQRPELAGDLGPPPPAAPWMISSSGMHLIAIDPGGSPFKRNVQDGLAVDPHVAQPLWVSQHPVTAALWEQFAGPQSTLLAYQHDVEQTIEFCNWLSAQEGLTPAYQRPGEQNETASPASSPDEPTAAGSQRGTADLPNWQLDPNASGYRLLMPAEIMHIALYQLAAGTPWDVAKAFSTHAESDARPTTFHSWPTRSGVQIIDMGQFYLALNGAGAWYSAYPFYNRYRLDATLLRGSMPQGLPHVLVVARSRDDGTPVKDAAQPPRSGS